MSFSADSRLVTVVFVVGPISGLQFVRYWLGQNCFICWEISHSRQECPVNTNRFANDEDTEMPVVLAKADTQVEM